jgi:hypothetical protein
MYQHEAVTESPIVGASQQGTERRQPSAAERRDAARRAYRQSITTGQPLTGVALGQMFGLSARWGSERAAEVRAEMAASLPVSSDEDEDGVVRYLPIGNETAGGRIGARAPRLAGNADRQSDRPLDGDGTGHDMPAPPADADGTGSASNGTPAGFRSAEDTAGRHADETRPDRRHGAGWERHTLAAGKAAVRLVAAAVSYEHMRTVAEVAGETGWRAVLLPISVDGLAVLALVTLRAQRRDGVRPGWAWVALLLALIASLAANVAAAQPTPAGRLVAAWPPVALFLAELMDKPRTPTTCGTTAVAASQASVRRSP